eukprot:gene5832-4159_t
MSGLWSFGSGAATSQPGEHTGVALSEAMRLLPTAVDYLGGVLQYPAVPTTASIDATTSGSTACGGEAKVGHHVDLIMDSTAELEARSLLQRLMNGDGEEDDGSSAASSRASQEAEPPQVGLGGLNYLQAATSTPPPSDGCVSTPLTATAAAHSFPSAVVVPPVVLPSPTPLGPMDGVMSVERMGRPPAPTPPFHFAQADADTNPDVFRTPTRISSKEDEDAEGKEICKTPLTRLAGLPNPPSSGGEHTKHRPYGTPAVWTTPASSTQGGGGPGLSTLLDDTTPSTLQELGVNLPSPPSQWAGTSPLPADPGSLLRLHRTPLPAAPCGGSDDTTRADIGIAQSQLQLRQEATAAKQEDRFNDSLGAAPSSVTPRRPAIPTAAEVLQPGHPGIDSHSADHREENVFRREYACEEPAERARGSTEREEEAEPEVVEAMELKPREFLPGLPGPLAAVQDEALAAVLRRMLDTPPCVNTAAAVVAGSSHPQVRAAYGASIMPPDQPSSVCGSDAPPTVVLTGRAPTARHEGETPDVAFAQMTTTTTTTTTVAAGSAGAAGAGHIVGGAVMFEQWSSRHRPSADTPTIMTRAVDVDATPHREGSGAGRSTGALDHTRRAAVIPREMKWEEEDSPDTFDTKTNHQSSRRPHQRQTASNAGKERGRVGHRTISPGTGQLRPTTAVAFGRHGATEIGTPSRPTTDQNQSPQSERRSRSTHAERGVAASVPRLSAAAQACTERLYPAPRRREPTENAAEAEEEEVASPRTKVGSRSRSGATGPRKVYGAASMGAPCSAVVHSSPMVFRTPAPAKVNPATALEQMEQRAAARQLARQRLAAQQEERRKAEEAKRKEREAALAARRVPFSVFQMRTPPSSPPRGGSSRRSKSATKRSGTARGPAERSLSPSSTARSRSTRPTTTSAPVYADPGSVVGVTGRAVIPVVRPIQTGRSGSVTRSRQSSSADSHQRRVVQLPPGPHHQEQQQETRKRLKAVWKRPFLELLFAIQRAIAAEPPQTATEGIPYSTNWGPTPAAPPSPSSALEQHYTALEAVADNMYCVGLVNLTFQDWRSASQAHQSERERYSCGTGKTISAKFLHKMQRHREAAAQKAAQAAAREAEEALRLQFFQQQQLLMAQLPLLEAEAIARAEIEKAAVRRLESLQGLAQLGLCQQKQLLRWYFVCWAEKGWGRKIARDTAVYRLLLEQRARQALAQTSTTTTTSSPTAQFPAPPTSIPVPRSNNACSALPSPTPWGGNNAGGGYAGGYTSSSIVGAAAGPSITLVHGAVPTTAAPAVTNVGYYGNSPQRGERKPASALHSNNNPTLMLPLFFPRLDTHGTTFGLRGPDPGMATQETLYASTICLYDKKKPISFFYLCVRRFLRRTAGKHNPNIAQTFYYYIFFFYFSLHPPGHCTEPTENFSTPSRKKNIFIELYLDTGWTLEGPCGVATEVVSSTRTRNATMSAQGSTISLQNFEVLATIGRGSFGRVYLVKLKSTGELFAMKTMNKIDAEKQDLLDQIFAEKSILQTISHPFVVSLRYAFQTKERLFLVLDLLAGGELFHHLVNGNFDEYRAKFYTAQIGLMLFGLPPFYSESQSEMYEKILSAPLVFPDEVPLSEEGKDLLTKLLDRDPDTRLQDVEAFKAHPFFHDINFDDLYQRKLPPPFKPNPDTLQNFDTEITSQPINLAELMDSGVDSNAALAGFTYNAVIIVHLFIYLFIYLLFLWFVYDCCDSIHTTHDSMNAEGEGTWQKATNPLRNTKSCLPIWRKRERERRIKQQGKGGVVDAISLPSTLFWSGQRESLSSASASFVPILSLYMYTDTHIYHVSLYRYIFKVLYTHSSSCCSPHFWGASLCTEQIHRVLLGSSSPPPPPHHRCDNEEGRGWLGDILVGAPVRLKDDPRIHPVLLKMRMLLYNIRDTQLVRGNNAQKERKERGREGEREIGAKEGGVCDADLELCYYDPNYHSAPHVEKLAFKGMEVHTHEPEKISGPMREVPTTTPLLSFTVAFSNHYALVFLSYRPTHALNVLEKTIEEEGLYKARTRACAASIQLLLLPTAYFCCFCSSAIPYPYPRFEFVLVLGKEERNKDKQKGFFFLFETDRQDDRRQAQTSKGDPIRLHLSGNFLSSPPKISFIDFLFGFLLFFFLFFFSFHCPLPPFPLFICPFHATLTLLCVTHLPTEIQEKRFSKRFSGLFIHLLAEEK